MVFNVVVLCVCVNAVCGVCGGYAIQSIWLRSRPTPCNLYSVHWCKHTAAQHLFLATPFSLDACRVPSRTCASAKNLWSSHCPPSIEMLHTESLNLKFDLAGVKYLVMATILCAVAAAMARSDGTCGLRVDNNVNYINKDIRSPQPNGDNMLVVVSMLSFERTITRVVRVQCVTAQGNSIT
jgi:hypothetical protein